MPFTPLSVSLEQNLMKARNEALRKRHVRAGFTLIEMMVVVAIIVALAGIGIFYMAGQADEGNKTKVRADIKSLTQASIAYKTQHAGAWPDSLQALMVRDDQGYGPYIANQENLLDPWGRPYNYDPSGQKNNGLTPDIWCDSQQFGVISNWTKNIGR